MATPIRRRNQRSSFAFAFQLSSQSSYKGHYPFPRGWVELYRKPKMCFVFFLDYVRIVLNIAAFTVILSKPFLTIVLHFTGGILLDVVDGVSARYFNQCKFKNTYLYDFHPFPNFSTCPFSHPRSETR